MHNSGLYQDPSTSEEESVEYVVINYPGIVKNVQKAIDSLGGERIINMVLVAFVHICSLFSFFHY